MTNHTVAEKRCTVCGEIKAAEHFNRDKWKSTGLGSRCKPCDRAHARAFPSDPSFDVQRQREAYQSIPLFRQQKRSHSCVARALKAGDLKPWPVCAIPECSDTKVVAHHADYGNPLGVTWLCVSHHSELHRMDCCHSISRKGVTP